MKKIGILLLFVCSFSAAFSQVVVTLPEEKYEQMKNEIDSLKNANDSIIRLIPAYKNEVSKFQEQIKIFKTDTAKLHKQIIKLDKKNIADLENRLEQKTDSIRILQDSVTSKVGQIASVKKTKYAEGQQNVYEQIAKFYQSISFDELIKSSTPQFVMRDLQLIGNDAMIKQKLQDLQTCFDAQKLLAEKYNEQKINNTMVQLAKVNQNSKLLEELKGQLEYYPTAYDDLKKLLNELITLDSQKSPNSTAMQIDKQINDIYPKIMKYIKENEFNFTDYPCLSSIVLGIMTRKQKDANEDIRDLLNEL